MLRATASLLLDQPVLIGEKLVTQVVLGRDWGDLALRVMQPAVSPSAAE